MPFATSRTYNGRLEFNQNDIEHVQNHHELMKFGCESYLNLFLNLFGAMTPGIAKKYAIENKLQTNSKKDVALKSFKQVEENKISQFGMPAEYICFLCWFSLELPADNQAIINQQDIKQKFKKYWGNTQYNEKLIDSLILCNTREGSVWVDRRETKIKVSESDLAWTIDTIGFFKPKAVESEETSTRQLLCDWWGTGKKNECEKIVNAIDKIAEIASKYPENVSVNTFKQKIFDSFQVNDIFGLKKAVGCSQGSPAGFIKTLTDGGLNLRFKSDLEKAKANNSKKIGRQYSDVIKNLQQKMIAEIGFFDINVHTLMSTTAFSHISSSRSNAVNTLNIREELFTKMQNAQQYEEIVDCIEEFEKEECIRANLTQDIPIESYEVRIQQLNGIEEVYAQKNTDDPIENAKLAYDGKFGNDLLFKKLLEKFPDTDPNLIRSAGEYLIHTKRKYQRLKLNCIPHYNTIQLHSWFGESKPEVIFKTEVFDNNPKQSRSEQCRQYKLNKFLNPGDEYLSDFIFTCFDRKGNKRKINGKIHSSRLIHDVYYYKPNVEEKVILNHHHFTDDQNVNLLKPKVSGNGKDVSKTGVQIYAKDDKWYFNIPVKFEYNKSKHILNSKSRIFGFDLGWREPACWSIVDGNGNVLEYGEIDQKILTETNKNVNVFEYKGRIATNDEVKWANNLLKQINDEDVKWAKNFQNSDDEKTKKKAEKILNHELTPFENGTDLSNIIKVLLTKIHRNNVNKDVLFNIINVISPKILSPNSKDYTYGLGAISWKRLELYELLTKKFNVLISVTKDETLRSTAERIRKKFNNLRIERYKNTASAILEVIANRDVDIVVGEDLEMKNSKRKFRKTNAKVSSWYSSRILKLISDRLQLLGKKFLRVDQAFTSHSDLDGTRITRKEKLSKIIYNKYTCDKIKKIISMKHLNPKSTNALYQPEWNQLLQNNAVKTFDEIINKIDNETYVPCPSGEWVQSKFLGLVKSDVLAASIIAKKAIVVLKPKN